MCINGGFYFVEAIRENANILMICMFPVKILTNLYNIHFCLKYCIDNRKMENISVLRVNVSKNLMTWNRVVDRSTRDHFFRIPHTIISYEPKF